MKPISQLSDEELQELARRASRLPDAPPALIRAAIGLFDAKAVSPLAAALSRVIRRIEAALTFDSWGAAPMALGVRGQSSETRHLLYSTHGRDIDVRITPLANHFTVTGQILGPDDTGLVALASASTGLNPGAGAKVASLDALGEFRLEGVPGGAYVLTLLLGEDEIVLPPIELGGERP